MKSDFSWEKKDSVCLQMSLCNKVLGIRNNSELVLLLKSNKLVLGLASYDPENNEVKDFGESWEHWSIVRNDYLFCRAPAFLLIEPFLVVWLCWLLI